MGAEEIRQLIKAAAATANEAFENPDEGERYLDFYDDSVVLHGYPPGIEGKDGARAFYMGMFTGLKGGHVDLQEVLVEGDTAAVRIRVTGTHGGDLMGVPPSGKPVDVTGQSFIRVRDGKFVERIMLLDNLTLLQQIGVVPALA